MPKVGNKKFGYGAADKKKAADYADKTGKKMTVKKAMPRKKK